MPNNDDVSSAISKYIQRMKHFVEKQGSPATCSVSYQNSQEQASVECLACFMQVLGSASSPSISGLCPSRASISARKGIDRKLQMNTALDGRGKIV
jgi:hypothetical protein